MKKLIILCLTIVCFTFFNAQIAKFGKVTVAELQETEYPLDKEAEAAILFQKDYIHFPTEISENQNEVYVKIKIYDKDKAKKYLTKVIKLRKYRNNKDRLFSFKAYVYNLVDGKIEKTKVEKSHIFKEEQSKYLDTYTANFPNVKNGSIIEYKYTLSSHNYDIPITYFQYDIPLKYSEFKFSYPDFMIYVEDKRGEYQPYTKVQNSTRWKERTANVEEVTYKNVPARRKETFVINANNLRASLRYELAGITLPKSGVYENFSKDWRTIFKELMLSNSFGGQIHKTDFVKETVDQVTKDASTPLEKISRLLDHVQETYIFNRYIGKYSYKGVKNTYKEKKGSSADLNFLLICMLREAGIQAYPFVLSTVDHGFISYQIPSNNILNYVITAVEIDEKYILMDAANKYSSINQLPKYCLNDRGFVVKENSYKTIPILNSTMSRLHESISASFEEGEFVGKYSETKSNYFAISELEKIDRNTSQYKHEFLANYNLNKTDYELEVSKSKVRNRFQFQFNESVDKIGDKIIFNPLLFTNTKKQIFNSEKRTNNLEFGTPYKRTKKVTITIPEGYKVEEIPENKKIIIPNKYGEYSYFIKVSNNKLHVLTTLRISTAIMPAIYYKPLKELWQEMINLENQLVVFVKE